MIRITEKTNTSHESREIKPKTSKTDNNRTTKRRANNNALPKTEKLLPPGLRFLNAMGNGKVTEVDEFLDEFAKQGATDSKTIAAFLRGDSNGTGITALNFAVTNGINQHKKSGPQLQHRAAAIDHWGDRALGFAQQGTLQSRDLLELLEARVRDEQNARREGTGRVGTSALRKNLSFPVDTVALTYSAEDRAAYVELDIAYLKLVQRSIAYLDPKECEQLLATLHEAQRTNSSFGGLASKLSLTVNRGGYKDAKRISSKFATTMKEVKNALKEKIESGKPQASKKPSETSSRGYEPLNE